MHAISAGGVLLPAAAQHPAEGKEQGDRFFIRIGLSPADARKLRKVAIQLSIRLNMGVDVLLSIPVSDFLDIVREVAEVVNRRKRV